MANSNKDNYTDIPKNYQKFVLVQSPHVISKDYGYEEDVIYLLNLIKYEPNNEKLEANE